MEVDQKRTRVRGLIPLGMILLVLLLALIGMFNRSGGSERHSDAAQLEQKALKKADQTAGFAQKESRRSD